MSYSMVQLLRSNEWHIRLNVQVMVRSDCAMRVRKIGEGESSYISF